MSTTIDPWELGDAWQLEEGPDGEVEQSVQLPPFIPVVQPAISAEEVARLNEPAAIICILCGQSFETNGILRVCKTCWNGLITAPKVHLRLEGSEQFEQGVVTWDHGNIGSLPHDKDAVPIGIWGKYGMEGEKLTYWVSLCKPVEAIHDMMTQFSAALRDRQSLFNAQIKYSSTTIDNTGTGYKKYSKSTRPVVAPKPVVQPIVSAADKLRSFLGR
jgi:hypothetical protein